MKAGPGALQSRRQSILAWLAVRQLGWAGAGGCNPPPQPPAAANTATAALAARDGRSIFFQICRKRVKKGQSHIHAAQSHALTLTCRPRSSSACIPTFQITSAGLSSCRLHVHRRCSLPPACHLHSDRPLTAWLPGCLDNCLSGCLSGWLTGGLWVAPLAACPPAPLALRAQLHGQPAWPTCHATAPHLS
jgi:hypothetical protein